jgi:raffinose/stachyose/melibiose transport system substrate-binding protein
MRVGIGWLIDRTSSLCGTLAMPMRALLAVLAIAMLLPTTTGGVAINRRIALVVGNGAYEQVSDLANPTNDAEAISGKLQGLGFEVLTATNLDLAGMRDSLHRFGREMAGAEVGLVFYAGHGLQVAGENFLIPVDAQIQAPEDLVEEGLQVAAIHAEFAAAKPKVALLILDACRDNPFLDAEGSPEGLTSGSVGKAGLAQVRNTAGMLIAFAAAPGAVAADGRDGNSPFTTALLRWVDKPDLEIGLMFRRVRQTVLELTGGAQTPWVEESLLDEVYLKRSDPAEADETVQMVSLDAALWKTIHQIKAPLERRAALEFYDRLLPESEFSAQARVEKAAYAPAQASEDELVRQGLVWLSIRNSDDPDLLEEYLRLNPDSMFADLARQRLADLRAAEEAPAPEPAEVLAALEQPASAAIPMTDAAAPATPVEIATPTATLEPPPVAETPVAATGGAAIAAGVEVPAATPIDLGVPAGQAGEEPPTVVIGSATPDPVEPPPEATPPAASTADPATGSPSSPAEASEGPTVALGSAPEQPASGSASPASPGEAEEALDLDEAGRAAVQRMLAAAGAYRGRIDADFGPGTRRGISAFQRKAGIEETGYLSQPTLRHLMVETAGTVLRGKLSADERAAVHRVAAIARNGPGSQPTRVRFVSTARNDDIHEYWREVADTFEAEHPGVAIDMQFMEGELYKTSLLQMLGSAEPPDVLYTWGGGHIAALAEAGFVRDLTSDMADGWAMTFKPGALGNFTVGERIYGVPMHMALVSFWYNKSLFDRAGIDVAAIRTWDDLLEAVQRLKQAGITPIAAGGGARWPLQFYWGSLAQQIGGEAAFRNALAGAGSGFEDQVFVRAGEQMQRLAALDPFTPDFLEISDSKAAERFAHGNAAMILTGNWHVAKIGWNWQGGQKRAAAELGRFDFPAVEAADGEVETYGGTDGWAVNAQAPDEAVAFVRYLADAGVQREMAARGYDVPAAAAADDALQNPLLREAADLITRSTYHQLYYDQALGPEAGEVVNDIAVGLAKGTIEPAAAAAAVENAWEAVRF